MVILVFFSMIFIYPFKSCSMDDNMYVCLSGALVRTGVLDKVGDFISSNTKKKPFFVILLLILVL